MGVHGYHKCCNMKHKHKHQYLEYVVAFYDVTLYILAVGNYYIQLGHFVLLRTLGMTHNCVVCQILSLVCHLFVINIIHKYILQ